MENNHGFHSPSNLEASNAIKVLVIGGSIAGLSCAHALIKSGCNVTVFEKSSNSLIALGAGLGIDGLSSSALEYWGFRKEIYDLSLPLVVEEDRAINVIDKSIHLLYKDENLGNRAWHWSDLHRILKESLPEEILFPGHEMISFEQNEKKMTACILNKHTNVIEKHECDILVAANGSMSNTRAALTPENKRRYSANDRALSRHLLGNLKFKLYCYLVREFKLHWFFFIRYAGYCAWRGVLDFTSVPDIACKVKKAYDGMGKTLYFEISHKTHSVFYELKQNRFNWLWYCDQPEPEFEQQQSVTLKPKDEEISEIKAKAREFWVPELAEVIDLTPAPFINAIYDREPLDKFVYGRVVLLGESAHSTTPHALRSTNMSIMDAYILGCALEKWTNGIHSNPMAKEKERVHHGSTAVMGDEFEPNVISELSLTERIDKALKEYEETRVPVVKQEVLFSRHLGVVKQSFDGNNLFDKALGDLIGHANMHKHKFT